MEIGVVFPQTELATDAGAVRSYVRGVEELGFTHVLGYDHVVGADPAVHRGWDALYNIDTTFHELMVLFGFVAGISRLEVVTGIVIAPQRQTVLLAKQAAEVDILSEGRFRLGLGVGWNKVEYEALGKDFASRGRRIEEQVDLLRRLWTERSLTHAGTFEQVTGAGIAPRPVQRPIPIWLGGVSPVAYRRIGRLADGWIPQMAPGPKLDDALAIIESAARQVGRDPGAVGMQGRITPTARGVEDIVKHAERWRQAGATHVAVNTMGIGLSSSVDDQLRTLAEVSGALGLPAASAPAPDAGGAST